MVVLSLFDGISCGQVALERAGISASKYSASEIDKNAIKITQNNYPNTVQLGDINDHENWNIEQPDLIIGGSPCKDLSFMKTGYGSGIKGKGLKGEESKLFFKFAEIWERYNPKFFLLENVPMNQESIDIISNILGVHEVEICSSLFSAQTRKRLYWTNIPIGPINFENREVLRDIVEPPEDVYAQEGRMKFWYGEERPFTIVDNGRVFAMMDGEGFTRSTREVQSLDYKSCTLLADGEGGNRQKKVFQDGKARKLTPLEYERLQTLPDNYTACVAPTHRYNTVGNGWTVDVIAHILKGVTSC